MNNLPCHGRINCTACYEGSNVLFDKTMQVQAQGNWRITANPLAWGNPQAEIVVLGFSKGPTQAGALEKSPHNEIAYKGSRLNVGKILSYIGLLQEQDDAALKLAVDREIASITGRFHFGSLIRCTVERFDEKASCWKGSGGGMLDKFVSSEFGKSVAQACTSKFLGRLPERTKLVVMFGMGSKLNYVREANKLFKHARAGNWVWINDVSYTDGIISVVHVEHFASQGALISNWLGINNHERNKLAVMAKSAIKISLGPR